MSNIDKIRQEIERRKKICEDIFERESDTYYQGKAVAYGELFLFIDSLPDEPVSNDLEEAAKTFCDTLEGKEAWSYGPSHYDWDDVNNAFIAGAEWMAKQKEQKPAQSEEEKEYVRTLKGLVSDFIRDSGGGITDVEYYQNICDWLDGRHIEQKPAEWDDYTKTNLGRAIQIIKDARGTLHGYQTDDGIYECDKAIEALEHFLYRGLEIEKSAEWSEEDEDKVVQYLHDRDGGMLWSKATDITRDILDMLCPVSKESLQPHWKPSENQMSMLLAVVNDPNNAGSASCHLSLKSLYNDLKKL